MADKNPTLTEPPPMAAPPEKGEPEGAFELEQHRRKKALEESVAYAKAAKAKKSEAAKGAK